MIIEPDGSVTGTAVFGVEALDCATEEELDEEPPETGDDPLSGQRAEVPEAGIAMVDPGRLDQRDRDGARGVPAPGRVR